MIIRFKRRVSFVNAYFHRCAGRAGYGMIEVGELFEEPPRIGFGVRREDFEQLPDPRDDGPPADLNGVASDCDALLQWIGAGHLSDDPSLFVRVVAERLRVLADAAAVLPDAPAVPLGAGEVQDACSLPDLVTLIKKLRQWAADATCDGQPITLRLRSNGGKIRRRHRGGAKSMRSAAKETTADDPGGPGDELSNVAPHPTTTEAFGAKAVGQLAELIRSASAPGAPSAGAVKPREPMAPRLTVDLPSKMLTFDGTAYPVRSERALRWVKVLADRAPAWVSSKELSRLDRDLLADRTDKFKKSLPAEVLKLIDSQTGAGSRIRL
jgi:hypothetical protein